VRVGHQSCSFRGAFVGLSKVPVFASNAAESTRLASGVKRMTRKIWCRSGWVRGCIDIELV